MYVYIMRRTQIYLTDSIAAELQRRSALTGTSKSELIRRALEHALLGDAGPSALMTALKDSAGAWESDCEDGASYVERLRRGRLGALHNDQQTGVPDA